MLQGNPFFSSPLIFFGSFEDLNEEENSEEWNLIDTLQVSLDSQNIPQNLQPKIGLFIDWSEPPNA